MNGARTLWKRAYSSIPLWGSCEIAATERYGSLNQKNEPQMDTDKHGMSFVFYFRVFRDLRGFLFLPKELRRDGKSTRGEKKLMDSRLCRLCLDFAANVGY